MDQTADSLDAGLLRYSEGAVIGTGGFVQADGQRLDVRNVLPIVGPDDLAKIPLEGRNGTNVRLDDVASVGWGHQPLIGDAVIDDGRGLMLIVQKFPNANTLEVTRGIEETVDDMRPGLPAMELDTTIFRPATFIEQAFGNLTRALLLGVLLVVLILAAFLFEWRTAFISLIAIPLSLLAAILVLQAFGTVINVMILAGLIVAIGVVVDDAIIDVENVVRRLRQERSEGTGKSTIAIVLEASVEVRTAITYATLINVIAVVPVFFLEGLSGAFFKPLVLSYGIAVLVSMIVALTVTPALCLIMLSRGHRHQESPLLRVLKRGYGAVLARVVRTPSPAIVTVAVVMLAGVVVAPSLGTILLPSFKERDFLMHWLAKPGTSQPEEFRISVRACKDLQEIPGVRNCGSHIGQAFQSDEPYGVDFGENWVSINPAVDYDKTLASVSKVVDAYPGLYRDVQTYLRERVREVLTGTSEAIVVRIYGPELDVLYAKADEVSHEIEDIPGLIDTHPDLAEGIPQTEVEVDLAAAQAYGLKPGDVRRQASTLVASEEVGDIFRGGKAYDVHVWSTPETRNSVSSVRQLPIDTPGGEQITLEQVADVRLAPTPNAIERVNQSRRIDVGANVEGRDLGSTVSAVEDRIAGVDLPPEYTMEVLGESSELAAAQQNLLIYGGAAAHRDLVPPAGFFREYASGAPPLPYLADGTGGRSTRGVDGRRHTLARLADRVPDRVRHRGAKRDFDDQSLPAPRARRGRGVRARARPARGEGAARADPDDRRGYGPGARAAGGCGQRGRSRDRAPDGDSHPGRARHLDTAQPLRPALPVPPVREEQEGACALQLTTRPEEEVYNYLLFGRSDRTVNGNPAG